jgi:hypothetical protein
MKTVYLFDENTKELISAYDAQESPLEEGVYLTPHFSTDKTPLTVTQGKYNHFNGTDWELKDDTRGNWYKTTRELVEVTDLLTVIDATWVRTQPPVPPLTVEEKRALLAPLSAWQIRKVLNQAGLRKQVEDAVLVADSDTQDAWHYASNFQRDDAILNSMAVTLGITATQLDGLFELGITL